MYEKFTDRARRSLVFANEESVRLRHEFVGADHILLGLLREKGVAVLALARLGIKSSAVRSRLEEKLAWYASGPEGLRHGKREHAPNAKKAIEYAIATARERNDTYVGTEHLLAGVLKTATTNAAITLSEFGVTSELLETATAQLHPEQEAEFTLLLSERKEALAAGDHDRAAELSAEIATLFSDERAAKSTEDVPEATLRQITCALLRYHSQQSSAQDTLDEIQELVT